WSDGDARMGVGLQERSGRAPRALYALPVTPDFFARTPGRARRRSGVAAPRALLGRALDDLQIECGRGQRARVRLARRGEDLLGSALLDDDAVLQHQHAVAHRAHDAQVVADE